MSDNSKRNGSRPRMLAWRRWPATAAFAVAVATAIQWVPAARADQAVNDPKCLVSEEGQARTPTDASAMECWGEKERIIRARPPAEPTLARLILVYVSLLLVR